MFVAIALALQTSVAAVPAPIHPVRDTCISASLPSQLRTQILAELQAGGHPERSTIAAVYELATVCASSRGWNEGDMHRAITAVGAQVMRDDAIALLSRAGINIGLLDRWFANQPPAFQAQTEMSQAEGRRVYRELRAAGVTEAQFAAHGEQIVTYFAALSALGSMGMAQQ